MAAFCQLIYFLWILKIEKIFIFVKNAENKKYNKKYQIAVNPCCHGLNDYLWNYIILW